MRQCGAAPLFQTGGYLTNDRAATQKVALEAMQERLMEEGRKNERLLTERDSAENRARTLGNEMTDTRRRISDRDEKYGYLHATLNVSNTRPRLHESATRVQVY